MRSVRLRIAGVTGLAIMAMTAAACGSSTTPAATSAATSAAASASEAMSSAMTSAMSSGSEAMTSAMSSGSEAMTSAMSSGSEAITSAMSSANSGSTSPAPSSGGGGGDPKTATSLADFGGMDGLVAAAKAEGALNVIALPPDWANYKSIIAAFAAKYPGIKIEQQQPNISSAQEIAAAKTNKGTSAAPDVFDLGTAVTLASTDGFAPYKVAAWADIPDGNKEPTGLWINDYTGVMTVGYDSTIKGDVTSLDQLLDPAYKGVVALNGNPTQAGAAFNGVLMASLANGGSLGDISKGVEFFKKVKDAGNLYAGDATPGTVQSGEVGVLLDWSYNQPGYADAVKKQGGEWKTFVPDNAVVGAFYNQAINKDAPHPAAARLWEEFLYSAEAQNLWLKGLASPILQAAMTKAGTIDKDALAALAISTAPAVQTADQIKTAAAFLATAWPKVVG